MKKNYNIPQIQLISLDSADVIATSITILDDGVAVNADRIFRE